MQLDLLYKVPPMQTTLASELRPETSSHLQRAASSSPAFSATSCQAASTWHACVARSAVSQH